MTPHILLDSFQPYRERYLRTYREVCGWHAKIGFDEMISHTFLSGDRLVQETRFSGGQGVVVNFGQEAWSDKRGFTVAPMSFCEMKHVETRKEEP